MFGMKVRFYVSVSGAVRGHHGPFVSLVRILDKSNSFHGKNDKNSFTKFKVICQDQLSRSHLKKKGH